MRALIIVNPVAGAQRPLRIAEDAAAHLARTGWEVDIRPTQHGGHATELCSQRGAADMVVAVGGDGTLRETVAGLDGDAVPVGFVPIGKANVMARELGIPRRPHAAIQLLTHGVASPLDVGTVDGRIFLAMVGIGYDGWVTSGVDAFRARPWGQWLYRRGGSTLLYVLAGFPALLRLRPTRVAVEADGRDLAGRYASVTVSNAATYSIGWEMTPGARVNDGILDHQANRRAAPWFVAWTLIAAILKKRLPAVVAEYGSAGVYRIRAAEPFRWQVDGDPMPPRTELEIGVSPSRVRIIVPAPAN
jgi:YegS/Rv2252/BmrU family lipid kinase